MDSASRKLMLSIDCEAEAHLCADLKVESYPDLKLFENAGLGYTSARYLGPRKASEYVVNHKPDPQNWFPSSCVHD